MVQRTRIKICGVRTPEIAEAAIEAGADMLGLVFVQASPRFVTLDEARKIARHVHDRVDLVGLFKDEKLDAVRQTAGAVPLTMAQIHGDFATADLPHLQPMRFMRTVAYEPNTMRDQLRYWHGLRMSHRHLTALVIDTPDPNQIGGGTGRTFDWTGLQRVLEGMRAYVPIMLAGGLTPDNVADAIRTVRPWAVDVSSGVERERGVKDAGRVRAFCEAARAADE